MQGYCSYYLILSNTGVKVLAMCNNSNNHVTMYFLAAL